jgi:hypothetical protein
MTRESLWSALAALGRRAREPVSIVLGGSAALILGAELRRPTDDGDVVTSEPGIGELQSLIRDVAASEGLPPGWLNGSIQSYTYVLPGDFGRRLVALPPIGRLSVSLLGRPDLILMKVYAMRPRDVEDRRQGVREGRRHDLIPRRMEPLGVSPSAKHPTERTAGALRSDASRPAILGPKTPDAGELDEVASYWARLGVIFGVRPATELVDVERLVCDTARVAPADERLFICAVSWLAQYHVFTNGRRLSALAGTLDDHSSAVLGALLSLASQAAGGAPELEAARARCRRLAKPQPLFAAMRSMRVLRERVERNALPVFAAWGLWHDDQTLKPAAIRPITWLLEKVPELRVRSLLGPSVEADLLARALAGERGRADDPDLLCRGSRCSRSPRRARAPLARTCCPVTASAPDHFCHGDASGAARW